MNENMMADNMMSTVDMNTGTAMVDAGQGGTVVEYNQQPWRFDFKSAAIGGALTIGATVAWGWYRKRKINKAYPMTAAEQAAKNMQGFYAATASDNETVDFQEVDVQAEQAAKTKKK